MESALTSLFERAFRDGCELELSQVLISNGYRRALAQFSRSYPPQSLEWRLKRAGHYAVGNHLAQGGRLTRKAIERLPCFAPEESAEFQALCHVLGDSLIDAAARILEPPFLEAAGRFAAMEDQVSLLSALSEVFPRIGPERPADAPEPAPQPESNPVTRKRDSRIRGYFRSDPAEFLPALFAKTETQPNCLGLVLKLLGFIRTVKLPMFLALPIESVSAASDNIFELMRHATLHRLHKMGFLDDDDFILEVGYHQNEHLAFQLIWSTFHGAAVFRLKNGRIAMLDPLAHVSGILPHQELVERNAGILRQLRHALPGLHLVSRTPLTERALTKAREETIGVLEFALFLSKDLAERIQRNPGTHPAVLFAHSPIFEHFVLAESIPPGIIRQLGPELIAAQYLYSDPKLTSIPELAPDINRMHLSAPIGSHLPLTIVDGFLDHVIAGKKSGLLPHRSFEMCNPEYNVGLRVLSDLSAGTDAEPLVADHIMNGSYSQLSLLTEFQRAPNAELLGDIIQLPARHASLERELHAFGLGPPDLEKEYINAYVREHRPQRCVAWCRRILESDLKLVRSPSRDEKIEVAS